MIMVVSGGYLLPRIHTYAGSSNYKNYKDTFVRVRGGDGCRDVMYSSDDEPLFPFYWTTKPRLIKGAVYERLSEFERDTMVYLESLSQMSPRDLLDAEGAPAVLERYLSKLFVILLAILSDSFLICSFLLVSFD
jgi:hypothetical protein